jgi:hypothetical protein
MATSLNQTINWAQVFIDYSPLTAGAGNEMAVTTANIIQEMMTSAPLLWPWNRSTYELQITKAGGQDYYPLIADFSYLEKVTLEDSNGKYYEIKDVFNNKSLSLSAGTQRPFAISVMSADYDTDTDVSGGNVWLRFVSTPDQNYSAILTYQQLYTPIVNLTDDWYLPDQVKSIYSWLFLAEAFSAVDDDQRAIQYRQRGVAALLARQAGLSDLDRSVLLAQWTGRELQTVVEQLKAQQATQARGV